MTKAELYRRFGPKLIDAIVSVIKDEINILRTKVGLPEKTSQQIIDVVETKLNSVEDYNWLNQIKDIQK